MTWSLPIGPVSVDHHHPLNPDGLQIDTYDEQAWIGVVPFRMTGVRLPDVRTLLHFARRQDVVEWLFASVR